MLKKFTTIYIIILIVALISSVLVVSRLAKEGYDSSLITGCVAIITFLSVSLVVFIASLQNRNYQRSLKDIEGTLGSMAKGDLGQRAPINIEGDLADISREINRTRENTAARFKSLQTEKSRLESLYHAMEEGVISIDADGRIIQSNESAQKLLCVPPDAIGKFVWDVMREDNIVGSVKKTLEDKVSEQIEAYFNQKDLSIFVNPIPDKAGVVLVAHDVTDSKRYESLRKEFVANVSHELRTPLTFIKGYVETLREGGANDPIKTREFLETINKHVIQLTNLVEDLLELSKLESGSDILKYRSVNIGELISRIAESFKTAFDQKKQQLCIDIEQGLTAIQADPDLLERAISNLLSNANKYTPDGGKIKIEAREGPNFVEIVVSDNGIGIPSEDLPRIFERFYRVDKSRSREMGGTGLGLAIVKHIVQLHNGTIEASSKLGEGSTFTIKLPI